MPDGVYSFGHDSRADMPDDLADMALVEPRVAPVARPIPRGGYPNEVPALWGKSVEDISKRLKDCKVGIEDLGAAVEVVSQRVATTEDASGIPSGSVWRFTFPDLPDATSAKEIMEHIDSLTRGIKAVGLSVTGVASRVDNTETALGVGISHSGSRPMCDRSPNSSHDNSSPAKAQRRDIASSQAGSRASPPSTAPQQ
jgi:hypothetical protein